MPARVSAPVRRCFLPLFAMLCAAPPVAVAGAHRHDAPVHSGLALTAQTLDGGMEDIAARKGWKVVYFWSAACPCVGNCERLTFLPLARQYKGKAAFYAVAANNFDLALGSERLRQAAQAHHLPYPLLLDRTHVITTALNARVTPQTFVLDAKNRIMFAGMPDDSLQSTARAGDWRPSETYLARALAACLAGQKIKQPRTELQGCLIDR